MFFTLAQVEWTIQDIQQIKWLSLPTISLALFVLCSLVIFLMLISLVESKTSRLNKTLFGLAGLSALALLTWKRNFLAGFFSAPQEIPVEIPLVILAGALFLYVTWMYFKEKKLPLWGRFILITLRLALLFLCFALLFQPIYSFERQYLKNSYVVILLDTSPSMSYVDRYEDPKIKEKIAKLTGLPEEEALKLSRLQFVKTLLLKNRLAILKKILKHNHLRIFTFGDNLKELADLRKNSDPSAKLLFEEKGDFQIALDQGKLPAIVRKQLKFKGSTPGKIKFIGRDKKKEWLIQGTPYLLRQEKKKLEVYDLSKMAKFTNLQVQGRFTRLGQSLLKAKETLVRQGHRIASMIVFTDGQSNGGLPPIKAAEKLAGSKIPLYIFGVGNTKEEKDIELFNLHTRKKAKVGDFIPFSLKIRSRGFKDKDLYISLKKNGKKVHSQFVHISGKSFRPKDVRIKYKVNRPGRYTFTLEVPPQEGETNLHNNRVSAIVEVKDKKLRILYVEGYPRWEYRYLKNALVRDGTIKVQCLLLSADKGYPQESSAGVTSLLSYPDTTLGFDPNRATHGNYTEEQKEDILKKLGKYNVIIFGDVAPSSFSTAQLAATAQFVEDGGGFVMISGEKYSPHSYYGTPLATILPVILEKPDLVDVPLDETLSQPFRPVLTPEGERHIIMRFDNDMGKNKELWESEKGLPGLYWFSTIKKVKAGAMVLAQHPSRKNKYGPYPLFALHNYGNGKVFFSAVDSTWRWRAGVGDTYFYSFWSQVIRHMSTGSFQDKDRKFILTTGQRTYIPGKRVDLYAIVRKSKKKQVEVKVFGPYERKKINKLFASVKNENPLIERKARWTAILNLIQKGKEFQRVNLLQDMGVAENFEGEFMAYQKGIYFLQLAKPYVTPKGKLRGGDLRQIRVTEYNKEKLQILLKADILKAMAKITGGVYTHFFGEVEIQHTSKQKFSLLGRKKTKKIISVSSMDELTDGSSSQPEITEIQKIDQLWKKWWILPIFLLLLIFEWMLRKFFRLL